MNLKIGAKFEFAAQKRVLVTYKKVGQMVPPTPNAKRDNGKKKKTHDSKKVYGRARRW